MQLEFSNGVSLELPDTILQRMIEIASDLGFKEESGGILLGSMDISGRHYLVRDFTFPQSDDERSPWYFIRKKDPSNEAIRKAWEESNGTINYLGEWHTHDEDIPTPSSTDKNLVREVIEDRSSLFEDIFMLIIGSGGGLFCGTAATNGEGGFEDAKRVRWDEIATRPEQANSL